MTEIDTRANGSDRWLALGAAGLGAGFLSGFFGIGGGLVLVPVLILAFGYPIKRAVGISLITVIGVSTVAVLAELGTKSSNIHWSIAVVLTVGSLVGSVIAGRILKSVPEAPLRWLFAACVLFAAYRMAIGSRGDGAGLVALAGGSALVYALALPVGAVAGMTSTLFGLGGGIVTVPGLALLYRDLPFHAARAISLVTIVPTSTLGGYQHYRMGNADLRSAVRLLPGAVVGAIAGVIAVNLAPSAPCKLAFAAFLALTAVRIATLSRPGQPAAPRIPAVALRYATAVAVVVALVVVGLRFAPNTVVSDPAVALAHVDADLATADVDRAVRDWHEANVTALRSGRWTAMAMVGDEARRIADRPSRHAEFTAFARQAYLGALDRARHDRALDGVVRVGEAFLDLGDRAAAEQVLRIASGMVTDDTVPAAARMHALAERLVGRSTARDVTTVAF